MKRLIILLVLSFLFINSISALDCQYRVDESYEIEEEWFYFDSVFEGVNLNIDEFVWVDNYRLTFTGYNNLTIPVKIQLNYVLFSKFFGTNRPMSVEMGIDPRDSEIHVEQGISSGFGNYYGIKDFTYTILSPKITSEYKDVEKQREICKTCPNGKQCKDDGEPCELNIECGSGICNIAKVCGINKTGSCPDGELNCNDESCQKPSIIEPGDEYSCEWECKSGRGEDGVCLKSIEWWIYFLAICILILSGGVGYFAFYKRWREEKERDKIKAEKENLSIYRLFTRTHC